MKIINIDPTGADREIAETGEIVPHGGEVDVDSALAGRPPSGKPGEEGYDPGEGLLAQADVWQRATTKAAKAAKEGS